MKDRYNLKPCLSMYSKAAVTNYSYNQKPLEISMIKYNIKVVIFHFGSMLIMKTKTLSYELCTYYVLFQSRCEVFVTR